MFLEKYNKSYNSTEYQRRLEIYRKSVNLINLFNSKREDNLSAVYGFTEFTDLIPEILLSDLYSKFVVPTQRKPLLQRSTLNIPPKIDWREKGVVSSVNNQKACGACWAFTTIENIEAMNAIKTGKLERFSVQQMIDCSVVNNGCDGGDTCVLLDWIKDNNITIAREKDYPLHLVTESCNVKNSSNGIHITKFNCEK